MTIQTSVRGVNVHILIPCLGTWMMGFGKSLTSLVSEVSQRSLGQNVHTQRLSIVSTQSSLLSQNRELLIRGAMKSAATHVLLLDSDMEFPKDTLHRLIAHDVDFVACNYVTKQIPAKFTAIRENNDRILTLPDSHGLVEAQHVGLGVVLIKLSALRKAGLESPFFEVRWNEESSTYMGEDVFFCQKLREAGIKILVDQDLSKDIRHVGSIAFTPSATEEYMEAAEQLA